MFGGLPNKGHTRSGTRLIKTWDWEIRLRSGILPRGSWFTSKLQSCRHFFGSSCAASRADRCLVVCGASGSQTRNYAAGRPALALETAAPRFSWRICSSIRSREICLRPSQAIRQAGSKCMSKLVLSDRMRVPLLVGPAHAWATNLAPSSSKKQLLLLNHEASRLQLLSGIWHVPASAGLRGSKAASLGPRFAALHWMHHCRLSFYLPPLASCSDANVPYSAAFGC